MQTSLLLYDIPQAGGFPNPSGYLRSRALRINLSCWVVAKDRTPWQLLDQMTANAVDWHLIEFSESATAAILKLAAENMRRELAEAVEREQQSLTRSTAVFAEVEALPTNGPRTIDRARDKMNKDHTAARKRTEKLIKDLEHAADLFGMDVTGIPFAEAHARTFGAQALQAARAATHTAVASRLPLTPEQVEIIPVEIMADMAEERAREPEDIAAVTSMRSAFQEREQTTAANVAQVSSGHNGAQMAARGNGHPRVFQAMTRTGLRRVTSTFTTQEAAEILRNTNDSMGRSLANRVLRGGRLTARQLPWLHILAVENAPPAATTPTAAAVEEDGVEPNVQQQRREEEVREQLPPTRAVTTEGKLEAIDEQTQKETVLELNTSSMSYSKETNTLICEMSDAQLQYAPKQIRVRSHASGDVRMFDLSGETTESGGETIYWAYISKDGIKMQLMHD